MGQTTRPLSHTSWLSRNVLLKRNHYGPHGLVRRID
ncbi:hypothetical protein M3J09_008799 [Ascochyta lentis]